MDLHEAWNKALKQTDIIRGRVQALPTFADTAIPYILLSESSVNSGDTVVRRGEIVVDKPTLILPPHSPQLDGFDFEKEWQVSENAIINFLLVRGIQMPSFHYNNTTSRLDVFEGEMEKAITFYKDELQRMENVQAGLIAGPEDCWQFSVLIFICTQIARNADTDLRNILNQRRKKDL